MLAPEILEAQKQVKEVNLDKYDFKTVSKLAYKAAKGLTRETILEMSRQKKEPEWMLELRLKAYEEFLKRPMPTWGPDLSELKFDEITYYLKPGDRNATDWNDVPIEIRETFDKLGIPEFEKKYLAGSVAQYESESVYHSLKKEWDSKGVIFCDMDTAVQKHPDLVKKYFMKCVPYTDNKFAALHAAVWSGGCLTEDALVFTPNPGIKSIKDMKAGDKVFALSDQGKIVEAKVEAKINSGKKPVYSFRAAGRTIEATGNHHFLTIQKSSISLNDRGRKWYYKWKPLSDINEGELIAIAKKMPDTGEAYDLPLLKSYIRNRHLEKINVPKKTSEDLLWLLGILLGDGNIYQDGDFMTRINIALPVTDSAREKAIHTIKRLFNYEVKTKNNVSFTINSKALGDWLTELGVNGKAKTKTIPKWVFSIPRNQKLALLGGILDSDGYVDKGAGAVIRIELANEKLIQQIKLLAISCGLFSDGKILKRTRQASFLKKEKRNIYSGTSYSCRITGNVRLVKSRSSKILKKLNQKKYTLDKYKAITGENFASMTNEWLGFAPLKEKKLVGVKPVYDIQVEKHANFVTNGIIAHNSFTYVPPGVHVDMPLQTYFRMNAEAEGQFEHTLVIIDEGASATYQEGCTAPKYSKDSLHSAVVEIYVKKNAKGKYITVQNWSKNVYNLNTKRAVVEENGQMSWVGGSLGSKTTMLYPCTILKGDNSSASHLNIAFGTGGTWKDGGAKVIHVGKNTNSKVVAKSISMGGGVSVYRGLMRIQKGAENAKAHVQCDGLILDEASRSDAFPHNEIHEPTATVAHEASVGRISDDQLFYLMSRGLNEAEARSMIVLGFLDDVMREIPLEFSVEMNRLIQMEMSKLGAVG